MPVCGDVLGCMRRLGGRRGVFVPVNHGYRRGSRWRGEVVRRRRRGFCGECCFGSRQGSLLNTLAIAGPVTHQRRGPHINSSSSFSSRLRRLSSHSSSTRDTKRDVCFIPPSTSGPQSRGVNFDSTYRCNDERGPTEENLIRMRVNAISSVVSDGTGEGFGGDENGKSSSECIFSFISLTSSR